MDQTFYFNENIAFGQEITTKERGDTYSDVVFLLSGALHLQGVLHSSSLPDCIEDKKSGGQKQSELFSVSAGNDLRMSTMRPNPYLSAGIAMRRGEFRGLLQFLSRPN